MASSAKLTLKTRSSNPPPWPPRFCREREARSCYCLMMVSTPLRDLCWVEGPTSTTAILCHLDRPLPAPLPSQAWQHFSSPAAFRQCSSSFRSCSAFLLNLEHLCAFTQALFSLNMLGLLYLVWVASSSAF